MRTTLLGLALTFLAAATVAQDRIIHAQQLLSMQQREQRLVAQIQRAILDVRGTLDRDWRALNTVHRDKTGAHHRLGVLRSTRAMNPAHYQHLLREYNHILFLLPQMDRAQHQIQRAISHRNGVLQRMNFDLRQARTRLARLQTHVDSRRNFFKSRRQKESELAERRRIDSELREVEEIQDAVGDLADELSSLSNDFSELTSKRDAMSKKLGDLETLAAPNNKWKPQTK